MKAKLFWTIMFVALTILSCDQEKKRSERLTVKIAKSCESKEYDKAFQYLAESKMYSESRYYKNYWSVLNSYIPYLLLNDSPTKAIEVLAEYPIRVDSYGAGQWNVEEFDFFNALLIRVIQYFFENGDILSAEKAIGFYRIDDPNILAEIVNNPGDISGWQIDQYNNRIVVFNNALFASAISRMRIDKQSTLDFFKKNAKHMLVTSDMVSGRGDAWHKVYLSSITIDEMARKLVSQ